MRESEVQPLLRIKSARRQHHIHHARGRDYTRYAHGCATARKNAALAFRKDEEGRRLPSPHTCCRRKLKPAAHRRALYHIDDRDAAKLNLIKRLMLILGHTHEFYR